MYFCYAAEQSTQPLNTGMIHESCCFFFLLRGPTKCSGKVVPAGKLVMEGMIFFVIQ